MKRRNIKDIDIEDWNVDEWAETLFPGFKELTKKIISDGIKTFLKDALIYIHDDRIELSCDQDFNVFKFDHDIIQFYMSKKCRDDLIVQLSSLEYDEHDDSEPKVEDRSMRRPVVE